LALGGNKRQRAVVLRIEIHDKEQTSAPAMSIKATSGAAGPHHNWH